MHVMADDPALMATYAQQIAENDTVVVDTMAAIAERPGLPEDVRASLSTAQEEWAGYAEVRDANVIAASTAGDKAKATDLALNGQGNQKFQAALDGLNGVMQAGSRQGPPPQIGWRYVQFSPNYGHRDPCGRRRGWVRHRLLALAGHLEGRRRCRQPPQEYRAELSRRSAGRHGSACRGRPDPNRDARHAEDSVVLKRQSAGRRRPRTAFSISWSRPSHRTTRRQRPCPRSSARWARVPASHLGAELPAVGYQLSGGRHRQISTTIRKSLVRPAPVATSPPAARIRPNIERVATGSQGQLAAGRVRDRRAAEGRHRRCRRDGIERLATRGKGVAGRRRGRRRRPPHCRRDERDSLRSRRGCGQRAGPRRVRRTDRRHRRRLSMTSLSRPTSSPSTPPSRQRERASRAAASPLSPTKYASSRSARRFHEGDRDAHRRGAVGHGRCRPGHRIERRRCRQGCGACRRDRRGAAVDPRRCR